MTKTRLSRRFLADWWRQYHQWMYRGGRPNRWARPQNALSAFLFAKGLLGAERVATMEVPGRRTGRLVSFPLVVTDYEGHRYLVAMLGKNANWVRNVRAADGQAVLRHGRRETVYLVEVDPSDRAPILRRYLAIAPGARPHFPIDQGAPVAEFARIAPGIPVFRITDPETPVS
jgi:hypothetical protein